ncbi:PAS domain-containing sensor histidine kinase [Hymenobacter sp. BT175]|uniref:sensor histidine kinase n=1 Tax=Hymenobacter translucens TaxID=2886507 RepID=UPI001D0F37A8|nr:PAS domain-containing sensor histidine kinase [Hymenobacter translucens]MCC2548497.1 PAS domain-containing sensor histidine kinase [Hymenobacter translucens]
MPASPESVLLFNALPTPHLLLSPAFVIEAVSESYLRATLTRREQLVGQYMFDAFPDNPDTPEANSSRNVHASLTQVLATKQPQRIAQQHYDMPDPERPGLFVERHWQALNAPVLDAHGQVVQIIHAAVDVTAEVQAQARLEESQAVEQAARAQVEQQRQRFREVLTQMPAYIAVYQGPDHIYQFVNPAYQSLFPHRSFLGKPFREGTPEAEALGVVALFDQVYQTGEPVYLREMEGWFDFHGNGQPVQVFLNISLHPLRNVQGHIDGVMDFTYDVSEQVRSRRQVEQLNQELEARVQQRTQELGTSNEELQESNRQLTRTNANLDSFVYAASHDLKLPVLNLAGLIGELRRSVTFVDPAEEGVMVPLIEKTLRELTATLDDLAALGQVQHTASVEAVALADVVADVLQVLEPQVRAARARVTTDFAARPVVVYPRATLRTIVLNLLSNAFKYADPARPGRVHVSLLLDAGQPVLWVQDNGLGFDAEKHGAELFQLFERFHDHTEGTGVGLYLVNRLVQANGGRLEVDSRVGEGATFRVYLGQAPQQAGNASQ